MIPLRLRSTDFNLYVIPTGEAFHTAAWPTEFNPEGKRIAVIGTGASAVQVINYVLTVRKNWRNFLCRRMKSSKLT
jgi:cation diffusion facilitator CzcD-associated flavoprotein CzcO